MDTSNLYSLLTPRPLSFVIWSFVYVFVLVKTITWKDTSGICTLHHLFLGLYFSHDSHLLSLILGERLIWTVVYVRP